MFKITKLMVLAVLIFMATAAWAEDTHSTPEALDPIQLRGAWRVTQTPGEGGPPPFQMLMVFTRDGGVVETDAGPPNPLQFSPGLGEWKRKADGSGFVANYTQLQYDSGQNQIGTFNALIDVTLNEAKNAFSGTVRVRFLDLDDVLLFEGFGTVDGKRLPVE